MDELTCVGCGRVLIYPDPDVLVAKMAEHFEGCDAAKALLPDRMEAAAVVAEEQAENVAGHLLVLSTPLLERDPSGELVAVGASTVYFGPYETRQAAKDAG